MWVLSTKKGQCNIWINHTGYINRRKLTEFDYLLRVSQVAMNRQRNIGDDHHSVQNMSLKYYLIHFSIVAKKLNIARAARLPPR